MELQCNNETYTSHIASRVQFHFVARLGRSVFASAWLVVVGLCQRHWWHSGRRDNWQVMGWGVILKKISMFDILMMFGDFGSSDIFNRFVYFVSWMPANEAFRHHMTAGKPLRARPLRICS